MKISIITLFPDMLKGFFAESIISRAQTKGAVEIEYINLRDYSINTYGSVDGRPYGGGAGMVIQAEPVYNAVEAARKDQPESTKSVTMLTSAKGQVFNQKTAWRLASMDHLIIIAGHYEGYDERIMDIIDEEVSLGDFVMTGGEITAAAVVDAVVRLIPGVLKKDDAAAIESFYEVPVSELSRIVGPHPIIDHLVASGRERVQLLEYPHYTRPEEFRGHRVPDVLLSGHHKTIEDWRIRMAFGETLRKRPDLLTD